MNATAGPRAVIRRHSRSFSLAARLLATAPRRRAELLYAWCRSADDAIDLAPNSTDASAALGRLRDDLDAVYEGRPTLDPAAEALRSVVAECALPKTYPEDLLAGMAMDAAAVRYETVDELIVYCHRVAGVVGLMMCHALGVSDDRALPHAAHLGIAMQLTNVARDVAEDWSRGRLYLPIEWLDRMPDLGQPLVDAIFAPALRRLLALADRYYGSGDLGLAYLDRRSRIAVRVSRALYSAIGARIARTGYRVSAGRVVVPRPRICSAVLASAAAEVARRPGPGVSRVGAPLTIWRFQPLH